MEFVERINSYLKVREELQSLKKPNSIKSEPEDFLVEEIMENETVLEIDMQYSEPDTEGNYTIFVLQKKGWETAQALKEIGNAIGAGKKAFSFAGTKDRKAITTQLVSCYGGEKEKLQNIQIKDLRINGCWISNEQVNMGDLLGNRFGIKLAEELNAKAHEIFENAEVFPNFFGKQRFGYRMNNQKIGMFMLQSRMQKAVLEFLCGNPIDEQEKAREARKKLATELDFKKALEYFPMHLKHERTVIAHLAENERDYANAFRKLPRQLLLMFVHSYQSALFNTMLMNRVRQTEFQLHYGEFFCERNKGFPIIERKTEYGVPVGRLIGYDTIPSEEEKELLEADWLKPSDFKVRQIPELSSKGGFRQLFAEPVGMKTDYATKTLEFSLSKGCYATVLLEEIYAL